MRMAAGQPERASGGDPGQASPPRPSVTPYTDQANAATWAANKLVAFRIPRADHAAEDDAAYRRGVEAGYLIAVMRLREYADVARQMAAKVR